MVLVMITVCMVASIYFEQAGQIRGGVIISDSVTARQGDGESYLPSFKEPLHAGTEFDILEKRPDWLKIQLTDATVTWIPRNSAEMI
jgi:hypothetical protein